eukprot:6873565-Ditylum_brightwellii.AAC.1
MQYYPVTGKGVAKTYNQHEEGKPDLDSGQGATNSPAKWSRESSVTIKCHNKWAIGGEMTCPMKIVNSKWNNAMLVDNTTLFHNLCQIFSISCIALMAKVKCNVTLWGRYLWTSGGWLEIMKTQYCTLIWAFKEHGQPYLKN